jgi:hypothetical protein
MLYIFNHQEGEKRGGRALPSSLVCIYRWGEESEREDGRKTLLRKFLL